MSDKRAVEGAGPYDANPRFPVGEGLAPPAVPARVSDKRARPWAGRRPLRRRRTSPRRERSPDRSADMRERPTSGPGHGLDAGPYGADPRFPVGAIHESPADMRRCPTNGRPQGRSEAQGAPTERTDVSPQIPHSEFRIPNSAFISPPADSLFTFHSSRSPVTAATAATAFPPSQAVTSCHGPSRAPAPTMQTRISP